MLEECGGGDVVEVGAGTGRLAFDVLTALHAAGAAPAAVGKHRAVGETGVEYGLVVLDAEGRAGLAVGNGKAHEILAGDGESDGAFCHGCQNATSLRGGG